jgi:hypothetical protein
VGKTQRGDSLKKNPCDGWHGLCYTSTRSLAHEAARPLRLGGLKTKTRMHMKIILSTSQAADILLQDKNARWSYDGARALVEHLEQWEEETGEELELDVVELRCDWSEYKSAMEAARIYGWTEETEWDGLWERVRARILERSPVSSVWLDQTRLVDVYEGRAVVEFGSESALSFWDAKTDALASIVSQVHGAPLELAFRVSGADEREAAALQWLEDRTEVLSLPSGGVVVRNF